MAKKADEPVEQGPKIVWDDSEVRTTYANICNVAGTQEEIHVYFGTNASRLAQGEGEPIRVKLSDRIVLNPFTAKRLATLLGSAVKTYEARFGDLSIQQKPQIQVPESEDRSVN